jgi:hypothetical protein
MGPFISKFIEKIESMRVVLGGLVVYIAGLMILGFSLQTWPLVITGIIICSIGEFMVAPGYLAFVSKLAPKDNVSAYIGCNFISYMIGLLGGSIVFGFIVAYVGVELARPYLFYGILISFALFLFIAFIIYYRTWGQDVIARAKKIRELEEGPEKLAAMEEYTEPVMFRIFERREIVIFPMLMIPVVLFASFGMGTHTYIGPEEEDEEEGITLDDYTVVTGPVFEFSGDAQEQGDSQETVTILSGEGENIAEGDYLKSITFTLTWTDEDAGTGFTNEPDEFSLKVETPNGTVFEEGPVSDNGGTGMVTISVKFMLEEAISGESTGTFTVTVICGVCGDEHSIGPLGLITNADNGNEWDMMVTSDVYSPK